MVGGRPGRPAVCNRGFGERPTVEPFFYWCAHALITARSHRGCSRRRLSTNNGAASASISVSDSTSMPAGEAVRHPRVRDHDSRRSPAE
jgi:hypothetical protein